MCPAHGRDFYSVRRKLAKKHTITIHCARCCDGDKHRGEVPNPVFRSGARQEMLPE